MTDMNGIIETATGDLIRAGYTTFTAGAGETLRADVPEASAIKGTIYSTVHARYTGTWGTVANTYAVPPVAKEEKTFSHTVTAGDVTAGFFSLPQTPESGESVKVSPINGPDQNNKQSQSAVGVPDFDVISGNQIHFNNNGAATGLSEHIEFGDILKVTYEI